MESNVNVYKIKFRNDPMFLIGTKEEGALSTYPMFNRGLPSFAHLHEDGIIRQHGFAIGIKEEIEFEEN